MSQARVDVSVIVPAYRAASLLATCLTGILAQDFGGTFEVVVCATGNRPDELAHLPADPRLRLIVQEPRLSAAAARNRAIVEARGDAFAFTDADVVVPPGWLTALVAASGGERCVAGSVRNGTPDSGPGTVEYLVGFLDLHPARPPRTAWHGATCNLLLPRRLWERYGPFPEDMGGGEDTLLTVAAGRDGAFVFAPDAQVTHMNRTTVRAVLAHQYEAGRYTAHLARRSDYKLGALVRHTALAPLAVAQRIVSLYARVVGWERRRLGRALGLAPLVVLTLACWGAGLAVEGARIGTHRRRATTPIDHGE